MARKTVLPRSTDSRELEKKDLDTEKGREDDKRREEEKRREEDDELGMMENLESISAEDDAALKELLFVDEQYQSLLVLVS